MDYIMDWKGRGISTTDLVSAYKPKWDALRLDRQGFERLVIRRVKAEIG